MQLHENAHNLTLGHTKVANFHLHDVAYASAKVVTSSGLGGIFKRKYIV